MPRAAPGGTTLCTCPCPPWSRHPRLYPHSSSGLCRLQPGQGPSLHPTLVWLPGTCREATPLNWQWGGWGFGNHSPEHPLPGAPDPQEPAPLAFPPPCNPGRSWSSRQAMDTCVTEKAWPLGSGSRASTHPSLRPALLPEHPAPTAGSWPLHWDHSILPGQEIKEPNMVVSD